MKADSLLSGFIADEFGQGITEYGGILAFVAVLIGVVASSSNGALKTAVSQAFSTIASSLINLSGQAS